MVLERKVPTNESALCGQEAEDVHKRVFRLMARESRLLQAHVGQPPVRAHEGTVVTPASNPRWSSDALEIDCWNSQVVRGSRREGALKGNS